jgi:peroxiredoxin
MSDKLQAGMTLPDFELPDENGEMHRLSELQGEDPMILLLGRGEHCPRERQHQKGADQVVRVVRGRLHQPRDGASQRPA